MIRQFTPEEKELIVNTPITEDCFACFFGSEHKHYCRVEWHNLLEVLDRMRLMARELEDEEIMKNFLSMLPNSYKVVKL